MKAVGLILRLYVVEVVEEEVRSRCRGKDWARQRESQHGSRGENVSFVPTARSRVDWQGCTEVRCHLEMVAGMQQKEEEMANE